MSHNLLVEVACPNCQNPIDVREHGRHIRCDACSSQFLLSGHLCPQCNSYHHAEELFCAECGTPLTRTCRRCKHSNWTGDEFCKQCGEALDIFDLLALQHKNARSLLLAQREEEVRALRAHEAVAAEERLAQLQAIEEARQAELVRRLAEQQQQDKRLIFIAAGAIVFFLLVVIIYLFLSLLQ
jgi:uncharacterized protein YbaR (Trm112 family)